MYISILLVYIICLVYIMRTHQSHAVSQHPRRPQFPSNADAFCTVSDFFCTVSCAFSTRSIFFAIKPYMHR
eukprot:gene31878-7087_t